jgi:hypothetical protein
MSDKINPTHYDGDECMRVLCEAVGYRAALTLAVKHLWRAGRKEGESREDDAGKAKWYVNWALANMAPPEHWRVVFARVIGAADRIVAEPNYDAREDLRRIMWESA